MKKQQADELLERIANLSLRKEPIAPPELHELVWQTFNAGREFEAYAEAIGLPSFARSKDEEPDDQDPPWPGRSKA